MPEERQDRYGEDLVRITTYLPNLLWERLVRQASRDRRSVMGQAAFLLKEVLEREEDHGEAA